ncbi:uncharacterized protein LOC122464737 [Chelonia mydas]|uniref:uncharacterized protein LOC122464737 n=1 Tax=Chelonia mydas TaxID=8469 RepID=UPI001CA94EE8|nr:uncharacterized protein LOC122464737 [Chelonia mydas]
MAAPHRRLGSAARSRPGTREQEAARPSSGPLPTAQAAGARRHLQGRSAGAPLPAPGPSQLGSALGLGLAARPRGVTSPRPPASPLLGAQCCRSPPAFRGGQHPCRMSGRHTEGKAAEAEQAIAEKLTPCCSSRHGWVWDRTVTCPAQVIEGKYCQGVRCQKRRCRHKVIAARLGLESIHPVQTKAKNEGRGRAANKDKRFLRQLAYWRKALELVMLNILISSWERK